MCCVLAPTVVIVFLYQSGGVLDAQRLIQRRIDTGELREIKRTVAVVISGGKKALRHERVGRKRSVERSAFSFRAPGYLSALRGAGPHTFFQSTTRVGGIGRPLNSAYSWWL